ncbi:MAG: hypothetical protein Q8O19_03620 [Rectinemataceae bacterium]|nr:hypothetical protein [Rectinemataceae bacterium]
MKNYLVLISMSQANKSTGNKIVSNLKKLTDKTVIPAWIDSAYVGIPISTEFSVWEIWESAVEGINETSDLRDMLVIEIGRDWLARRDTRAAHWLTTHVGHPIPMKKTK